MFLFKKKNVIDTNLNLSEYLPVGTIVKVFNDDGLYMIYGYMGRECMSIKENNLSLSKSLVYKKDSKENNYYITDYRICTYVLPTEDDYSKMANYYIKHSDIKEIVYMGYDDEYRSILLNTLSNWSKQND